MACGFAYTAAVGGGGTLYTWGAGENGRLGTGTTADQPLPTAVPASSFVGGAGASGLSVRQVFAGSVHTCVLTGTGEIYSCGKFENARRTLLQRAL